ncbi:sugar phosphate isomerase/epimerase family protein [Arthrobacter oryzae]|uniref:sugar phosphate isomerase/epimerase family protein n=1 Tax=Arthrobacter oryzae TaxID=409290 RepID=UPI00278B7398|nr:sugar phosphate isomerase/epimerase family protein [Arthrobacter oryzae]MDQ0076218.1 D-psicose/D-tagatose/L-ribulose 3-epimerase [Arthrobacter oryzae]
MKRLVGISTWVWESPLTDANLGGLLAKIAAMGFDAVELPLENDGDFTPAAVRESLAATGLTPFIVGAMAPGRDLVAAAPASVERTQAYLMACITMAGSIGSPTVCGPFYAQTGRVWRMSREQRHEAYAELRRNLQPVAVRAQEAGVVLGIEPLNRYETSLINTVEQALEALEPLLGNGVGLALDSYHLHIEERSVTAAVRAAGEHLVHVQVCGNDRGAPGGDQTDWEGFVRVLDEVGYGGPLNIESFTVENAAIAVAASIWRPLAPSQDELATRGLAFLRSL